MAGQVTLTERELEIVRLVAWNNRDIGLLLGISRRTVRNLLTRANRKLLGGPGNLGERTRSRLLWTALCHGLVTVEELSRGPVKFEYRHLV